MKNFQLTLKGYDAGGYATDHLIKWVRAVDRAALQNWLYRVGLVPFLQEINDLQGLSNEGNDQLFFDSGIDLILDVAGHRTHGAAFYTSRNPNSVDIQTLVYKWIEESKAQMKLYKLSHDEAERRLTQFIKETDADTLAAIYAYVFNADVKECWSENENYLTIEFNGTPHSIMEDQSVGLELLEQPNE